jgi:radical SAM superfamily enzyme YgiQ (UPF0313 family)
MSKRLLLISPAHIVAGQRRPGPSQFPLPPLSLGYVAALTPPGWDVRILDENVDGTADPDWVPDLVGITTLTPTAPRAYELAARYRQRGAAVVLGGAHVCALPEEASAHADAVVVGDAEAAWGRLIGDFLAGELRPRYQGDFQSLAGLPIPRRDLYPAEYFAETIITSRGCTNRCSFCSIWRFYRRLFRTRPVEEVVEEMASLPPSKIVYFADDNLTLDRQRAIALCRQLVARQIHRPYALEGTIGLADDDELLFWLRRSGCVFVFVGLESLDPDIRTGLGKAELRRMGNDGYARRIARIHEHGMAVFGSFIVGLDGDTPATFDLIDRFSLAAGVDCTLVNILSPTPGTLVWDRLTAEGRLLYTDFPHDYAYYTQDNVVFRPAGMSPVDLQAGTRKLIGNLTRLPVVLRRARRTWMHTRAALPTWIALAWNWRTHRALRGFPLRDVASA